MRKAGEWMKILGALIILAGFILFWQYQYLPALISIVIGAIFLGKPGRSRDDAQASQDDDFPDREIVQVDNQLQKVRASSSEYRRLSFSVDGVESNNDDGSSRQENLRALCEGEDMAIAKVWFDDYVFGGKLAIRVMTDEGCVGQIRPKDVATVWAYFGKAVRMIYLEINRDKSGENSVYLADVVIIE